MSPASNLSASWACSALASASALAFASASRLGFRFCLRFGKRLLPLGLRLGLGDPLRLGFRLGLGFRLVACASAFALRLGFSARLGFRGLGFGLRLGVLALDQLGEVFALRRRRGRRLGLFLGSRCGSAASRPLVDAAAAEPARADPGPDAAAGTAAEPRLRPPCRPTFVSAGRFGGAGTSRLRLAGIALLSLFGDAVGARLRLRLNLPWRSVSPLVISENWLSVTISTGMPSWASGNFCAAKANSAAARIAAWRGAETQKPGSDRLNFSATPRFAAPSIAAYRWSGSVTSATRLKPAPVTIAITWATRP